MPREYEAFVKDVEQALSGQPMVLTLRDLTPGKKKYRAVNVRAIVSKRPKAGEPVLWLRSIVGVKFPRPCSVHVIEEFPDTFVAEPYSDLFEVMRRQS